MEAVRLWWLRLPSRTRDLVVAVTVLVGSVLVAVLVEVVRRALNSGGYW